MELPIRIATWRKFRGLTQAALAARIQELGGRASGSAVSYWEVGTSAPTQANLRRLVEALELTMSSFYGVLPLLTVPATAIPGEHVA